MAQSINQLIRILSGQRRPALPLLSHENVERFFSHQAKYICDDWTIAAREGRHLWPRRAS